MVQCLHNGAFPKAQRGGWYKAHCQECGAEGRWRRGESAAWQEIALMQKLAAVSEYAEGAQHEVVPLTPELLDAWEKAARLASHRAKLGEWNWPQMVRSLIAAHREKTP
jgi:hypothetical protein